MIARRLIVAGLAGAIWPFPTLGEEPSKVEIREALAFCGDIYRRAAEDIGSRPRKDELRANAALLEKAVEGWASLPSRGVSEADMNTARDGGSASLPRPETTGDCDKLFTPEN